MNVNAWGTAGPADNDYDYRMMREAIVDQREEEIIRNRTAQQNAQAIEDGDDSPFPYDDRDWHESARAQAEREVP